MNGRRLFREYAQSKGKEAASFDRVDNEAFGYGTDTLYTKDSKGRLEVTSLNYKDMVHWIIRKQPN
jgi:hypothetical protein